MNNKGYLRLKRTADLHALIIWPYGYSLKIEGNEIWIINEKGQAVTKAGDTIKLGGGFVDASASEERMGHALPEAATGPYFISNPL